MRILGLDLSLTSTGVASIGLSEPISVFTHRLRPPKSLTPHQRLSWLLERVGRQAQGFTWAILEGPSYGSPNAQHKMGGLWWMVAHGLWKLGIPYDVVTPDQLKIYATGKARVEKDEVLAQVIRRYPEVDIHGNDEADAFVLAALGAHYLGSPLAQLPKEHTRVLDMIKWSEQAQRWRQELGADVHT